MTKRNGLIGIRGLLCLLLCLVCITGCGRSLVITTGFGRGEVFRLGKTRCRIAQMRVYLLDLQKQSEKLYGDAIWKSSDREGLQQAVKDQALSQLTRVKALGVIAINRNIMLSHEEELLVQEMERSYYDALSEEEKKYIGLDEKGILNVVKEYVLAARVYQSLGDKAEEVYDEFCENTQCDLNTKYWQNVRLTRIEGNLKAPTLSQCCEAFFGSFEDKGADPGTAEDAAEGSEEDSEEGSEED